MSEEKEKKNCNEDNTNATDIIKELGLISSGNNFKSELQYINIIGSI